MARWLKDAGPLDLVRGSSALAVPSWCQSLVSKKTNKAGNLNGLPALTFVEPWGLEPQTFCLPVLFDQARMPSHLQASRLVWSRGARFGTHSCCTGCCTTVPWGLVWSLPATARRCGTTAPCSSRSLYKEPGGAVAHGQPSSPCKRGCWQLRASPAMSMITRANGNDKRARPSPTSHPKGLPLKGRRSGSAAAFVQDRGSYGRPRTPWSLPFWRGHELRRLRAGHQPLGKLPRLHGARAKQHVPVRLALQGTLDLGQIDQHRDLPAAVLLAQLGSPASRDTAAYISPRLNEEEAR